MDIFEWIKKELDPVYCTSDRFIYDDMESQSGRCLPVIYQPFDADQKMHWGDRGALYDYLYSTGGEGQKLLDFGPGDGWPSLIVAPFAGQVIGVDGSQRRVQVCAENARRMGIANAIFVYNPPGYPLPFADGEFDGIMVASSVEQTPDPKAILRELYRVLRPGGRMRMYYEALSQYRGGEERDTWLWGIDDRRCRLILFDRRIEAETVWQVGLTFLLPKQALVEHFSVEGEALPFRAVTTDRLEALRPRLLDARAMTTCQPSGRTLAAWMKEIGFRQVEATHRGDWFAGRYFDQLPPASRPGDLEGVDSLLRPVVKVVVQMAAPLDLDPMITAVK